jgi:catechol 2,3-dioxygenase-like lactoylglutathione lyase family enzyme
MIMGVDHVALSAHGIDSAIEQLGKLGYQMQFVERNLPNAEGKRRFVRQFHAMHAIAYCKPKSQSVALELVDHGGSPAEEYASPYHVMFSGKSPGQICPGASETGSSNPVREALVRFADGEINRVFLATFNTMCWWRRSGEAAERDSSRVDVLVLEVADLPKSTKFWTGGLGFVVDRASPERDTPESKVMSFPSRIPSWRLRVILVENKALQKPCIACLDDNGFPCIAFISTDLNDDRKRLTRYGASATGDDFSQVVGGRTLRLCIVRGPDTEPLELIQFS